ncbi:hypothetical protein IQ06DRAFT_101794 [Phaeosphaeriaceae sp. SRC1lsM3a]|nr:hypothetical protein IQ06DRAFT_101794 [Stagonospora sp. SRC1lsM3a]
MPPKKDTAADGAPKQLVAGFEEREVKMLAAAFISSTGPDKYDYDLMGTLTGNTAGSLKKMWPPVKKKAIEAHPSFATFLGNTVANIASGEPKTAAPAKAKGGRKRKADAVANGENDATDAEPKSATIEKSDSAGGESNTKANNKKKVSAKKQKKKVKTEVKSEEDSGDGLDAVKDSVEEEQAEV